MGIYSRYVLRQAGGAVLLILSTLIIIIWVSVALKELKLMTSQGQSAGVFLYMTILAMPQIVGVILPVALLIACIHTLNKASGDSEIIVMTAAGAGRWQMAKPMLLLGFLTTLMVVANNAYLQPTSMRELRNYIVKVRADLISHVLQPGRFTNAVGGLTFHIRNRDENGDILGFILHDTRNGKQTMSYMAARSQLIKKGDNAYMVMYDGHIHRQTPKADGVQIIQFEKYVFDLAQFGQGRAQKIDYKVYESYIGELYSPPPDNYHFKKRPGTFRAELHDRLSNPLYPLLFVLVAVAALGYARTTRENRLQTIAIAFGIAAAARLGGLSAVNLLAKHEWAMVLVWGIPVGGILAASYVIQTRGIPGPKTRNEQAPVNVEIGATG